MDLKHPTVAEINLANLSQNLLEIRKLVGNGVQLIPIVKADAYGHGAVAVSKRLSGDGCQTLGVGYLEEGLELRSAGIPAAIIVFCGIFEGQEELLIKNALEPVVYTYSTLDNLEREAQKQKKKVSIHVKLDTGMGRLGFSPSEAVSVLTKIASSNWVNVKGVLTHFAESESNDPSFTLHQGRLFKETISELSAKGLDYPLVYASNSAGTIQFGEFHFNAVRPGLILYGISPLKEDVQKLHLAPVMELKTRIVQLKRVPSGTSISYGRTFFTKRDSLIAILPLGYADGYSRGFSNRAEVLVNGKRVRQVGMICMDSCMIDATDVPQVKVGDTVVVLGGQGPQKITAKEMAGWGDTIAYEIFCGLGRRVKRQYIGAP